MSSAIIQLHAAEAAVLWGLRESAAEEPHYNLRDLAKIDGRVEANLDALRLAGDAGWEACKAQIGDKEVGEVFAACAIAIDRKDAKGLAFVLDRAGKNAGLFRGLEGAFAWPEWSTLSQFVRALLDPRCPPALHRIGIAACAAHGVDPGAPLDEAVHATDAALATRALLAAGEIGRPLVVQQRRDALSSSDPERRFAAAWTLARIDDPEAIDILLKTAIQGGPRAARAGELGLRKVDPRRAMAVIEEVSRRSMRAAIILARATGLPDLISWLLDCAAAPEHARVAAQSIALPTGLDLVAEKLSTKAPEGFQAGPSDDPADGAVERDPDENLPWPDLPKLRTFWARNRSRFAPGVRHLLGKPISADVARAALDRAMQPARAAAAHELALLHADRPFFDVRAPAHHQARRLGGGS